MDYIAQSSIADIEARFSQESFPLFLFGRIATESFSQGDWAFCRNRTLSALERSGDGSAEDVNVVVKQRFEFPDVVEILHAAVEHSASDKSFEFLGYRRFRRVYAHTRCRKIKERRVVGHFRRWRDGIAHPDFMTWPPRMVQ